MITKVLYTYLYCRLLVYCTGFPEVSQLIRISLNHCFPFWRACWRLHVAYDHCLCNMHIPWSFATGELQKLLLSEILHDSPATYKMYMYIKKYLRKHQRGHIMAQYLCLISNRNQSSTNNVQVSANISHWFLCLY